jgi:hypothetical protein
MCINLHHQLDIVYAYSDGLNLRLRASHLQPLSVKVYPRYCERTIFPPGPPKPSSLPCNFFALEKMTESIKLATVRTPPMIAHVLIQAVSLRKPLGTQSAYEVRKCAKDWRISVWMTFIGDIS